MRGSAGALMLDDSAVLEIRELSCGYDTPLFADLSLRLAAGESVALMGRSGTGKTTILNTALGFIRPLAGQVLIGGVDIHTLRPRPLAQVRLHRIGVVFQRGELISGYTAIQNVMIPRFLAKSPDAKAHDDSLELLNRLEVSADTLAEDLSGGERQRVALARALINRPSLLLADEPTGSLDPQTRDDVMDLIMTIVEEASCALLIVTHDPAVAARARRTITLDAPIVRAEALAVPLMRDTSRDPRAAAPAD